MGTLLRPSHPASGHGYPPLRADTLEARIERVQW